MYSCCHIYCFYQLTHTFDVQWSDVPLHEEIIDSKHIIAGMPLKCEQLSGLERVKRAFLPSVYVPPEDKEVQPYNFNMDSLR